MPRYVKKSFEELDSWGDGVVKLVRTSVGATAFGMQIFEFREGSATPLHDESASGQEELYMGLEGQGWMELDGERVTLGPREVIFVPPGVPRTTVAGPGGLTFLAVGAVPHPDGGPNRKFDG